MKLLWFADLIAFDSILVDTITVDPISDLEIAQVLDDPCIIL